MNLKSDLRLLDKVYGQSRAAQPSAGFIDAIPSVKRPVFGQALATGLPSLGLGLGPGVSMWPSSWLAARLQYRDLAALALTVSSGATQATLLLIIAVSESAHARVTA